MLRICSLGSGSKGNAILIKNESNTFLIDCGLNIKDLSQRLEQAGHSVTDIDFVLLTHEHNDHIKSAESLSDEFGIPLVGLGETMRALCLRYRKRLKNASTFALNSGFLHNGLVIEPFKNSHDVPTVGYSIKDTNSHIVYATDLGYASGQLVEISQNADTVMLESNYDLDLLLKGSYPYYLKRRIASSRGHLSNSDCCKALYKMALNGTKNFILGHLSEENNNPSIVKELALQTLNDSAINVKIALQNEVLLN